jgi:acetylornithine deacetylase/succinyl-diaminopimelate desuccinylase-like protein
MNEGDFVHVRDGGRRVVQVAVAEKTPCWVKLTATGDAGHGSTPPAETAVTRLVRALDRVRGHRMPIRVVPAVGRYFAALAAFEEEPLRAQLADLSTALQDPVFLADFTSNPRQNALVRTTLTPTVLEGSPRTNVIPGEANAHLDGRLLPGERPEDLLATLRRLIADDAVRVEPTLSFAATASDPDSAFVAAVRRLAATEMGDAPVVPSVIPGFTDSHWFRQLGIDSYGFVPFVLTQAEARTVHGVDERVSLENLERGVRHLVALLRLL